MRSPPQACFITNNQDRNLSSSAFLQMSFISFSKMFIIVTGTAFRIYLSEIKKEESKLKQVFFGLSLLAFASVGFIGMTGGEMVYNFMSGI